MSEKVDPKHDNPFENGKYLGNIWGWKFSFIGLAFMVVFGLFVAYLHWSRGISFRDSYKSIESIEKAAQEKNNSDTITIE